MLKNSNTYFRLSHSSGEIWTFQSLKEALENF